MSETSDLARWFSDFLRDRAFLERYPYYAAVLAKLTIVADPSVERMAVSLYAGRFYLHVAIEQFQAEPQYLTGVLLHEVHHLVLGHLTHPKFAAADQPDLMDLALEMSANEYIQEPLPPAITWQDYARFGIRAGQSTLERYRRLLEAAPARQARLAPGGPRSEGPQRLDDHRFLGRGAELPGGLTQTQRLVKEALVEQPPSPSETADPERPDSLIAGRTPGRLLEELTGTSLEPRHFMDWKTALRMFVARGRAPVHTYARPSRRFPGSLGQFPGRTYAPRALAKPYLLIAIDTSLSMSRAELAEVGRQLACLAEHATLTIAECDTEVLRIYPFTGALDQVTGRGGTDLRPVFTREILGATQAQGVVYFTDGLGPTPEEPPPLPTLWILTKPQEFGCLWGERAWLGERPSSGRVPARGSKARVKKGST